MRDEEMDTLREETGARQEWRQRGLSQAALEAITTHTQLPVISKNALLPIP